eukprot:Amastigsp_a343_365.p6 type:complete len:103 gc:universal Amastigsp_a343_365:1810-1502(-)
MGWHQERLQPRDMSSCWSQPHHRRWKRSHRWKPIARNNRRQASRWWPDSHRWALGRRGALLRYAQDPRARGRGTTWCGPGVQQAQARGRQNLQEACERKPSR